MKEVTYVLTVQFTKITKADDKSVETFMQNKEVANEMWLRELQAVCSCDDIQIVKDQTFIRDMED